MERISGSYSTVRNLTDDLISLHTKVDCGDRFPLKKKKTYSGVMYIQGRYTDHTFTAL